MKHFRRYIQASASVAVFAIMLTAAISSVTAEGRDYVYTHGGAGIAEPYKTTTWDISGIGELDLIQRRKAPQYQGNRIKKTRKINDLGITRVLAYVYI